MNSNISLSLNDDEFYSRVSPVECWKLNLIAFYCVVLFTCSIIVNSLLVWIFYKYKELRTTPVNVFVLVFTVLSLIGSISEAPFVIASNFQCRWIWGKFGCRLSAFVMYFIASTQMLLITACSIVRFWYFFYPKFPQISSFQNDMKSTYVSILICFLIGLFCAIAPFFGWSFYTMEKGLTSCCIEWNDRSFNVVSYNIFIFVVTFFLPLIIMIITNLGILHNIRNFNKLYNKNVLIKYENQINMIMIAYIAGFFASWTPYAVVSFYAAFIGDDLSPLWSVLPAMFAKSEFLWSSLVFIWSNKIIRIKLREIIKNCMPNKADNIIYKPDCNQAYTLESLQFQTRRSSSKKETSNESESDLGNNNKKNQNNTESTFIDSDKSTNKVAVSIINYMKSNCATILNKNSGSSKSIIDSDSLMCFPEPMFKEDPEYMKHFNRLIKDFHTKVENFNLKFLIDRINSLKTSSSKKTKQNDDQVDSYEINTILSKKTNIFDSNDLKKIDEENSSLSSSFSSLTIDSVYSDCKSNSFLNRNVSNHKYNLRKLKISSSSASLPTSSSLADQMNKSNNSSSMAASSTPTNNHNSSLYIRERKSKISKEKSSSLMSIKKV